MSRKFCKSSPEPAARTEPAADPETVTDRKPAADGQPDAEGKRAADPEDDGRTIANMNVPGMPWYVEGDENRAKGRDAGDHEQMTKEELRTYQWAALRAALLVVLVFGGVFFLFIAFCDFVWFR